MYWRFVDVKYYIKNVDKNGDGRIEQGLWESPPPPITKG
jgi:hypothetical protein